METVPARQCMTHAVLQKKVDAPDEAVRTKKRADFPLTASDAEKSLHSEAVSFPPSGKPNEHHKHHADAKELSGTGFPKIRISSENAKLTY